MDFQQKLESIIKKNNSLVCVGLDPEVTKIPQHLQSDTDPIFSFNKAIIDATADLVCVYKPNIAFYEAEGIEGLQSLKKTVDYIRQTHPEIPIILDAKRGDVDNTSRLYARAAFDFWGADAVTVFPHIGRDAIEPFLTYKEKMTFLLLKTSNPDSKMFSDLKVDGKPYFLKIAEEISTWNTDNIGFFVGATYPEDLQAVRTLFPTSVILTAGVGTQGAETEQAVRAGMDSTGGNLICNNSRGILYAGNGADFAQRAREETQKMKEAINTYRTL